jgi:hypothetical protein
MSDTLEPPAHLDNIPPPEATEQAPKRPAFAPASQSESGWSTPVRPPRYLEEQGEHTPELNKAVADVLAEMKWVEKRGHNKFFNYDYATADDIREHVARLLGGHGLSYVQHEDEIQPSGPLLRVTYWFQVVHQSGQKGPFERVTVLTNAISERGKADDKALSKARVLALKDWTKNRFSIPAGDDPSTDPDFDGNVSSDQPQGRQQPSGQQQASGQQRSDRQQGNKLDQIASAATRGAGSQSQQKPPLPTAEQIANAESLRRRIVQRVDELPDPAAVAEFLSSQEVDREIVALRKFMRETVYRGLVEDLASPERIGKTMPFLAPHNPPLHGDIAEQMARQNRDKKAGPTDQVRGAR